MRLWRTAGIVLIAAAGLLIGGATCSQGRLGGGDAMAERGSQRLPQIGSVYWEGGKGLSEAVTPGYRGLSRRERLIGWLRKPNVAVTVTGAGILLLFVECNLPGAVVPGALGLLFLLSGIYGLTLLPLRLAALMVLAGAALALLASTLRGGVLSGICGAFGTVGLIYGLGTLVRGSVAGVDPRVAISVGAAVGLSGLLLGRVARKARRNKAVLSAGS